MHRGKIRVERRSQGPCPTRVVVGRSELARSCESTRWAGFMVSRCSGTISEILAECQKIAPCVLVASQESLEELDAEKFSALLAVEGSVRVLVLGTGKSPDLVERFLSMGCMGYLAREVSSSTLRRAVRAIASGQAWADRETITRVLKSMILKQSLQKLTSRERDILRLLVSGLCNRAIADRLCITHETVRWHIREMYSKLGVQDRFSAIVYGKRLLDSVSGVMSSEIPSTLTPQPNPPARPQVPIGMLATHAAIGKLTSGRPLSEN